MKVDYLLDTNTCIALMKNNPLIWKKMRHANQKSNIFISAIVEAELWFGVFKSQKVASNSTYLKEFLMFFPRLPYESKEAEWYGEIKWNLKSKGIMIGENDVLIAAHALAHDLTLITANEKEFKRVKDLKIENWLK